jgi:nitroreductase
MELRDAMTSAWTNRHFRGDDVPDETIRDLLDVARFAPSGGNRQGWRVVVVKDPATRTTLRDLYLEAWEPYLEQIREGAAANTRTKLRSRSLEAADAFARGLDQVPVHLILCVDLGALQVTDAGLDRQSIAGGASIYPFAHNILLAARDAGLGAALTTLICPSEPGVAGLLEIPDGFAVAALIALGWPVEEQIPKRLSRRPVEEFAFRERFGRSPLGAAASPTAKETAA